MAGTRVRTARNADVPAIESLVVAAFAAVVARTCARPAALSTDWETVISALGVVVATLDDHVVGVLVAWPHPDHVLIDLVAVAPASQGTGIGTALLDRAELLAIESGTNALRLHADRTMTEALAWCPRRGLVEIGRLRDDVLLEKRLR